MNEGSMSSPTIGITLPDYLSGKERRREREREEGGRGKREKDKRHTGKVVWRRFGINWRGGDNERWNEVISC